MSEIIDSLLDKYKKSLRSEESITPELIESLEQELGKDAPNAESLAGLIRSQKSSEK